MKKTRWFGAHQKPVRPGFYEVKRQGVWRPYPAHTMLHFDGHEWTHTEHSGARVLAGEYAAMEVGDVWRGLTKEATHAA